MDNTKFVRMLVIATTTAEELKHVDELPNIIKRTLFGIGDKFIVAADVVNTSFVPKFQVPDVKVREAVSLTADRFIMINPLNLYDVIWIAGAELSNLGISANNLRAVTADWGIVLMSASDDYIKQNGCKHNGNFISPTCKSIIGFSRHFTPDGTDLLLRPITYNV